MINASFYKKILLIAIAVFAVPFFSGAQNLTTNPGSITLSATPRSPEPGEIVALQANSLSIDMNGSEIIWSVDGIVRDRGFGLRNFSTKVGLLGKPTTVSVTAIKKSGGVVTESITLAPSEIALVWEVDSYTPPFYKGRALPTSGETISVVAIPNVILDGSKVKRSSLVYAWKFNNYSISEQSGHGKNVFEFSSTPRTSNISVDVFTRDGEHVGHNDIDISTYTPKVLIYEKSPLLGTLYNKALTDSFFMRTEELTLDVSPFFYSVQNKNGSIMKYDWSINGTGVSSDGLLNSELVLRKEGRGFANLSLDVRNINNFFQSSFRSLRINFDD